MRSVPIVVLIGTLSIGSLAFADAVNFDNPTGDLGATHTYILDGLNIVAIGFNGGHLYGKNAGPGEQGLGLMNDPTGDHEIFATTQTRDFIQLDLLNLINANFHNFQFEMSSSTGTEQWQVSACSASGVLCSNASTLTGGGQGFNSLPVNFSATNHYLDFSANKGNVLLSQLAAASPVPEPRFYAVLVASLLALVGIVLRKRRTAEQVILLQRSEPVVAAETPAACVRDPLSGQKTR
jgi:hypothetical protein